AIAKTLPDGAALKVALTNGLSILAAGDVDALEIRPHGEDLISAQGFAGQFPIKVEYAIPFAVTRAGYADLDAVFTVIACVASASFLLFSLSYVRRSRVPAFDLERAIGRNE